MLFIVDFFYGLDHVCGFEPAVGYPVARHTRCRRGAGRTATRGGTQRAKHAAARWRRHPLVGLDVAIKTARRQRSAPRRRALP